MVVLINSDAFRNEEMEQCYVEVAKGLAKANRCIVLTGAGISCAAGIPDFRSKNGLYNIIKEKNPTKIVKGQDLFDANLFRSPEATNIFYRFMGEFKDMIGNCRHTTTHSFIKRLHDSQKLLRCYTQNIDDLEVGLTLNTALKPDPRQAQVVQLHGTMSRVICTLAPNNHVFNFSEEYVKGFKNGEAPNCPTCEDLARERIEKGKRRVSSGTLRPDIVLYNEPHPMGEVIGKLQGQDIRKRPDFLLIMGTSLKIPGCKNLVKEVAKKVHEFKHGKVVFVNLTEVGSEWNGIIDYHFQCSTDHWVHKVEPLFLQRYKPKSELPTLPRCNSAVVSRAKNEMDLELCEDNSFLSSALSPKLASPIAPPLSITGTPTTTRSLLRSSSAMPQLTQIRPFDGIPSHSLEDLELMDDDNHLLLSNDDDMSLPNQLEYDSDTGSEKTAILPYAPHQGFLSPPLTSNSVSFTIPKSQIKPTDINTKSKLPAGSEANPKQTRKPRTQVQPTPMHLRRKLQALAEERKKETTPVNPLKLPGKPRGKLGKREVKPITPDSISDNDQEVDVVELSTTKVKTIPARTKKSRSNSHSTPVEPLEPSATGSKRPRRASQTARVATPTPHRLPPPEPSTSPSSVTSTHSTKSTRPRTPLSTGATRILPRRTAANSARTGYSLRPRPPPTSTPPAPVRR